MRLRNLICGLTVLALAVAAGHAEEKTQYAALAEAARRTASPQEGRGWKGDRH